MVLCEIGRDLKKSLLTIKGLVAFAQPAALFAILQVIDGINANYGVMPQKVSRLRKEASTMTDSFQAPIQLAHKICDPIRSISVSLLSLRSAPLCIASHSRRPAWQCYPAAQWRSKAPDSGWSGDGSRAWLTGGRSPPEY